MKTLIKLLLTLGLFGIYSNALATTCSGGDFPSICNEYEDWGSIGDRNSRCAIDSQMREIARAQCSQVGGCEQFGGCFGFTPTGHWVMTTLDNGKRARCRCGCFTMDTQFATDEGVVSGFDIQKSLDVDFNSSIKITSFNILEESSADYPLNSVAIGPEKEDIVIIHTTRGSVRVTAAHPVVLANKEGNIAAVATGDQVAAGSYLLDDLYEPVLISRVERKPYDGKVINFHVGSWDGADHFVSANGFVLGDNAWQQALAQSERRILQRIEIAKILRN